MDTAHPSSPNILLLNVHIILVQEFEIHEWVPLQTVYPVCAGSPQSSDREKSSRHWINKGKLKSIENLQRPNRQCWGQTRHQFYLEDI